MDARREFAWDHTSEMVAAVWNAAFRKIVVTARQINPCRSHRARRRDTPAIKPLYLDDLADFVIE